MRGRTVYRAARLLAGLALLLTLACRPAAAQVPAPSALPEQTTALRLGDTDFHVVTRVTAPAPDSGASLVLINLHDDENTSVEAALRALACVPARLTELRHTGARNLTIRRGAETFVVDPNRIFTDAGAARSLASLSRLDTAMLRDIRRFADTLLALAGAAQAQTVVALHNNTDGRYSARSYLPGAEYAADAAEVFLAPGQDPDDFFFVTDRPLFDALAAEGFNVVLQHPDTVTDDGSLSVLAARQRQRYVNVEAEHGQVERQRQMIEALVRVLGP